MTLSLFFALAALALLVLRAVQADRSLADLPRLPMNWSARGNPTWTAPRRLALATVPALAAVVLALALADPERGLASVPAVLGLGAAFLLLQDVSLRLARRRG